MHVVIAIVGFRNASDISVCLKAVGLSTHTDFEVVICENGGPEAYASLMACIPECLPGGQTIRVILAERNLGYAGGVNVCLDAVPDADAFWVLNPDTQPEPESLAAMVRRLSAGTCDAVGCTLYLPTGKVQSYGGRWRGWLARSESIGLGKNLSDPVDVAEIESQQSYLNGASMLVGRQFLAVVGPMREDYFLYCEEVEWCLRGLNRGMRLGFAPEARVLHEQGTTTGAGESVRARPKMPVYLGERNKILLTQDCFKGRLLIAVPSALALLALRCLPRRAWRHFGYGVAGLVAGLRGERGIPGWMGA